MRMSIYILAYISLVLFWHFLQFYLKSSHTHKLTIHNIPVNTFPGGTKHRQLDSSKENSLLFVWNTPLFCLNARTVQLNPLLLSWPETDSSLIKDYWLLLSVWKIRELQPLCLSAPIRIVGRERDHTKAPVDTTSVHRRGLWRMGCAVTLMAAVTSRPRALR